MASSASSMGTTQSCGAFLGRSEAQTTSRNGVLADGADDQGGAVVVVGPVEPQHDIGTVGNLALEVGTFVPRAGREPCCGRATH